MSCGQAVKLRKSSSLYLYCEQRLREVHEEFGYSLDNDGIGPFAIYCQRRGKIVFTATDLTELQSDDVLEIGPPGPYEAIFASPELIEITIVTPSRPENDSFSRQIVQIVVHNCIR